MNTASKTELQAASVISDPRWTLVVGRDLKADGRFFYSVKTTGVYCRPSCAARTPRPENVAFHRTTQDAERAGFRPCKRCKPDQASMLEQYTSKIIDLCRYIESAETLPTLDQLAQRAGLSAYYLHRLFKKITGLTPKAYGTAHRVKKIRQQLVQNNSVTDAIYSAGYNSNGRFYAEANQVLGMTPTQFRAGGEDTDIRFAIGQCSLGAILVAQSARGICAIHLGDDADTLARTLQDQFPQAHLTGGDKKFEQLVARVIGFVEAPAIGLDLPLDVRGTAFQQRVWQALRKIPVGKTLSYSEVAKKIGAPKAFRAVATACAANTLAIAIPCHRVVRSNGELSGYRWGVERKSLLLKREAKAKP
jgi:AraC family transcriptional regulator, regulatory protein of adaptative response / methylated-DNA-[protein]-cysteine methyltransferase